MKFNKIFLTVLLLAILPFSSKASVEVVGSLRHVHKGVAGEVYQGEIKVKNTGAADQQIKVYQTDLLYNYKNETFYNNPGSQKRSNANWIQFSPKTAVVKAHSSIYIRYKVTVPKSDTLKGSYWSVIMVEGVNPIVPSQKGITINTVIRYAIQIVTEMQNKGVGKLVFLKPTLDREGDSLYLDVDMRNTGDHYIAPDLSMKVFTREGNLVKTLTATRKGIFPACSMRYRFNLKGIKSGHTYQTVIVAQGEGQDVFGLNYTLYF